MFFSVPLLGTSIIINEILVSPGTPFPVKDIVFETSSVTLTVWGFAFGYELCVQLNWLAAVLLLPDESLNLLASTSIVVGAPFEVGVNVAV